MKLEYISVKFKTWNQPETQAWCSYCERIDARENVDVTDYTFFPKFFLLTTIRDELEL